MSLGSQAAFSAESHLVASQLPARIDSPYVGTFWSVFQTMKQLFKFFDLAARDQAISVGLAGTMAVAMAMAESTTAKAAAKRLLALKVMGVFLWEG
ncbi:hypothetical protein, partial [Pontixanthobacter sp. CEM42]|uniref:hypothetical protein n=1 Tax=Pontixanthobacter sp. CEM42 TaxID=2792077 RepID=UPI001ADFE37E